MNILWLTKENPLRPDRGDLLYANGLVRALAHHGHRVTVVANAAEREVDVEVPGVTVLISHGKNANRIWSLFSPLPSDSYRNRNARYVELVAEQIATGSFRAVVIDYFAMGWILEEVKAAITRLEARPLLIYLSHNYETGVRAEVARNFEGPLHIKAVLPYDAWKVARLEQRLLREVDMVTANTDDDREAFRRDAPETPGLTLTPCYSGTIVDNGPITAARARRVVLVGAFDWIAKRQNLKSFVKYADAPFRAAGIELLVVGRAGHDFIAEVTATSGVVRFTGPVPEIQSHLVDARIGLMPDTLGGGFKHKILDYIFNGLPVATIRSQAAGLPLDYRTDMIAEDTLPALVERIVATIDDIAALDLMRIRSFDACSRTFDWNTRGEMLARKIEELSNQKRYT